MIRKILFWMHLILGVAAGLFIFIMAATGVLLAFERQIIDLVDRDVRSVAVPPDTQPQTVSELLEAVRRSGVGDPTAIVVRNEPQAATQFAIGRGKTVYVDPYSGAVLGLSSQAARNFFSSVESLHRALGARLGSKSIGRWLTGTSNLLFCALIPFGIVLWLPRKWNWRVVRASLFFRARLHGKARDWNWHNVLGIWSALPLLVIALTGVVMSFNWANAMLFRLTNSTPAVAGRGGDDRPHGRNSGLRSSRTGDAPNYDRVLSAAKALGPRWRTITVNVGPAANGRVSATVDTGAGGQPQDRAQYLFDGATGAVTKVSTFADGSLGQKLRTFVRFGHTGEYYGYGLPGQGIAALASLSACVLVYTGLSLALRRLVASLKRKKQASLTDLELAVGDRN